MSGDVMTDQRSTRRMISGNGTPEPAKAPDVSSIIDEIDGIVEGINQDAQVVNSKAHAVHQGSTEDPARMQTQDAFKVDGMSADDGFDINRLEEELNVAIAAELGEEPKLERSNIDSSEEQTPTSGHMSDEDEAPGQEVRMETELVEDRLPKTESELKTESTSTADPTNPTGGLLKLLLSPFTAPVERLSPGGRVLLNVVVISTALWVPLVWLAVVTNGFGFLPEVGAEQAVTGVEGPVDDGVGPVAGPVSVR
ncbi:MAG: hypothetical protein MK082_01380 [Phycisphaerales bacterium]|nr:hypothetical protein [Phycisphaerales bacterium]